MKYKNTKSNKKIKNKTNQFLFYLFCILTLSLTVGYSAINSDITVTGEASFRVIEDIRITDVSLYETTNNGLELYNSNYSKDTIKTGVELKAINSTVKYKVEVTNTGTVAMMIKDITNEVYNNSNTEYTLDGYTLKELIQPGEVKEFYITFKYKSSVTTLPSTTGLDSKIILNFVKPESVLAQGSGSGSTSTFFNNGPIQKGQVETITFLPTIEVPESEEVKGYWDASYSKDGTVIAWYTDTDNNNLYELNIGGVGGVYAPAKSGELFKFFSKLTTINFGNYFNTEKVTSMNEMFRGDAALTKLDLKAFNTENVTSMYGMFQGCSLVTDLDVSSFNTEKVTSMEGMFSGCSSLEELDITSFNTENVTNMAYLFTNCSSLNELDLSSFNTANVTNMGRMFRSCSSLIKLDLSNFNTEKVTTLHLGGSGDGSIFTDCSALKILNLSSWTLPKVSNFRKMFYNCASLETLNISNMETSSATNMNDMFYNCSKLTYLDISSFNTSKVTEMNSMFSGCSKLTSLDLSSFNTEKVTSMKNMFMSCSSLTELDVSSFNTENVTNMGNMFRSCSSLTELDLSNFNTEKVTTLYVGGSGDGSIFTGCSSLEKLNLSSWKLNNVSNLSKMFLGCISLTELDIRNVDFTNATNYTYVFDNVPVASLIIVKDDDSKAWVLARRSDLTNVKTVSEL